VGTAFLILLLLVLCGAIAYIGDLLGRRFGKKRLSIFGLRPKHTAIVLTIATGVLIAAVTFSIALASVPGFRRLVTEGERLAGQNVHLASQNLELERQAGERKQANMALEKQNHGLEATNTRLEGEKSELITTNKGLAGQNGTLKRQNTTLTGQNTGLRRQNRSLDVENRRLAAAERQLEASAGRLRKTADRSRAEAQAYERITRSYQERAYIYRKNEEIERRVFPAGPPRELVAETVNNALFAAAELARKRNPDSNASVPRIILVKHFQHPPSLKADNQTLRNWVVNEAARVRDVPLVIRVVANENVLTGRPVPVRLEWYRNDRVLRKDQEIAEYAITVPPPQADLSKARVMGAILRDLVFFLQTEVGPTATGPKYAMIAAEDVGKLEYEELLPVCERIYDTGGRVRVVAKARQDTLRAGPLFLDLDVEPMERRAVQGR
jgi:hypothetical protein